MNSLSLGAGSFEMPLNAKWQVKYFEDDMTKAEVRFETGQYPVLGVKIISRDDPKLDRNSELKQYLFDETLLKTNPDLNILKLNPNVFGLEYEANLESGEKAKVWRIAASIGDRTVRVVTLALSWMSGGEADKVVKKILEELSISIKKCHFSDLKTDLDKEADALAKIDRLKLKEVNPWPGLSIILPASWLLEINNKDKSMALKVTGYDDAMFFLNCDEIDLKNEVVLTMDYMKQIASNLGEDPGIKNISLHSSDNNMYLISCHKFEKLIEENLVLRNCFWHIFIAREKKLHKLNFTYVFPEDYDLYLNNLIQVLDKNIKNLSFS
tara:strand:- start:9025 stop:9999 length:975 start_codon:yes stop_codon:yes gene_type:complete